MNEAEKDGQPLISLEDVSLRIGGRIAFPNTHWSIRENQHWAIIGANGSGKSSLAKVVCGMLPAASGRIRYHFRNRKQPHHSPAEETTVWNKPAYVCFDMQRTVLKRQAPVYQARWQSSENIDTLTVSTYLSEAHVKQFNPYRKDNKPLVPEIFAAQRNLILSKLAIQSLMEKKIVQLSNGEMRKIMLARALLKSPRVLILDNPFTGIDSHFRARLAKILRDLMKTGTSVMVVASRKDEILPGISHVLAVENERIFAMGHKALLWDNAAVRKLWRRSPATGFYLPPSPGPKKRADGRADKILVQMKNVTVSYNGNEVLRNIDWTVLTGENWAVLGPNGAGKTTLLSLIIGDNPQAYANNMTLFGRQRGTGESIWEIKKKIGFVSPELHLHYPQQFSGFEVVCSGFFDSAGFYHRCSGEQLRCARLWMERLGMSKFSDEKFNRLSDGVQRMLLLTRALVKQPELLVLDEPCQGLDAENRHRIIKLLDAIGNNPEPAIIFVTHDIAELPGFITNILRLENGEVAGASG